MDEYVNEQGQDGPTLPPDVRVLMDNASITWGFSIKKKENVDENVNRTSSDVNLKNIYLEAKTDDLIAIVGTVGWGKSTMLAAIMNELDIVEGTIKTQGTKAYVEQEPFIISGTVKENIIFGSEYDDELFKKTVEVWWLAEDFQQMQYGAETIIGERGINISGGQKARISLARAVYSNADIYLLDDPLSAVDPDVASKIFNNCINGHLKGKWRILATHQIQFLKDVNTIYLIEKNIIKVKGTYSDLIKKGTNFDEMIKEYNKNEDKQEDEIILDEESSSSSTIEEPIVVYEKAISKHKSEIVDQDNKKPSQDSNEKVDLGELRLIDWWKFFKYGSGVFGLILIILLSVIGSVMLIIISYIVGIWTKQSINNQQNPNYFHLFYGVILIYFLVVFLRSVWVYLSNMLASKNLHEIMIYKALRAPIRFFDANPIGRILTRLAQDIAVFDFSLPNIWTFVLNNLFRVFMILVLMCISVPYVSIPGVAWMFMSFIIRKISINPQNNLKRYDSITKAPINTKFGSAIDGVTTIRLYKKEEFFTQNFMSDLDINSNVNFTYQGIVRWAQLRLDMLSLVLLFINSFLIVILKNYTTTLLSNTNRK